MRLLLLISTSLFCSYTFAQQQKPAEAYGIKIGVMQKGPTSSTVDVAGVKKSGRKISVTFTENNKLSALSATHLLIATGRKPNTKNLDLEITNVSTDERGFIKVNDKLETSANGIYAMGDVTGEPQFTHISYNDYVILKDNLLRLFGCLREL